MSDEIAEDAMDQFDMSKNLPFTVEPEEIRRMSNRLELSEGFDADDADSELLAEYISALKALESAAEDARKDVFEDELEERVEIGQSIGDLSRQRGTRRYVKDDGATIRAIEEAGGDPTTVTKVKASDAADTLKALGLDPDEYIGEHEYSYFRRR